MASELSVMRFKVFRVQLEGSFHCPNQKIGNILIYWKSKELQIL